VQIDCDGNRTVDQSKEFEAATTLRLGEETGGFAIYCLLEDMYGRDVFHLRESNVDIGVPSPGPGIYTIRARIPALWLSPGLYALSFKVQLSGQFGSARYVTDKVPVDVEGTSGVHSSVLHPKTVWEVRKR
jgi:hypothetical protein